MKYMPTLRSGRPERRQFFERFEKFFAKFERAYFDRQRALAEREYEALSAYVPAAEIEESEKYFLISMDIPELKNEEVRVDLDGRNLRVHGERRRRTHDDDESYLERAHGKFLRQFSIPDNIDTNRIVARFDNGLLTIVLPKIEFSEPRKIFTN